MSADAEFGLIVSVEDQSASFVNGYEAGMLAVRMQDKSLIEELGATEIIVHAANRVTIERMCAAWGWSAAWRDAGESGEYPEWILLSPHAPKSQLKDQTPSACGSSQKFLPCCTKRVGDGRARLWRQRRCSFR